MASGQPFHIHFSDVSFANCNERAHVAYGQGTLRAEPLAEALTRFDRPATVIGESPDEPSNQAIREVLLGPRQPSAPSRPKISPGSSAKLTPSSARTPLGCVLTRSLAFALRLPLRLR
jgi:hypothetical protein